MTISEINVTHHRHWHRLKPSFNVTLCRTMIKDSVQNDISKFLNQISWQCFESRTTANHQNKPIVHVWTWTGIQIDLNKLLCKYIRGLSRKNIGYLFWLHLKNWRFRKVEPSGAAAYQITYTFVMVISSQNYLPSGILLKNSEETWQDASLFLSEINSFVTCEFIKKKRFFSESSFRKHDVSVYGLINSDYRRLKSNKLNIPWGLIVCRTMVVLSSRCRKEIGTELNRISAWMGCISLNPLRAACPLWSNAAITNYRPLLLYYWTNEFTSSYHVVERKSSI